jgi:hypothetical protein
MLKVACILTISAKIQVTSTFKSSHNIYVTAMKMKKYTEKILLCISLKPFFIVLSLKGDI